MSEVITRRPLSDGEIETILASIVAAETLADVAVNAIVGTFNALLADQGKTWADVASIDPTAYQIPEQQAQRILGAMGERARHISPGDAAVHVMLVWVDKGPSSYQPEN